MIKQIIGGVVTVVIGGTAYTVSQSDIASNFSKNAGVSQQQAQQYVNNINQSDLKSFSKVGSGLVSDGNTVISNLSSIDCVNYRYQWETPSLTCQDGKNQLQSIGNDEIVLGNCYESLGTDLGSAAKSTINECISDIDTVDSDYNLPIVATALDSKTISDTKNANIYNKSLLQTAVESK